MQLGFAAKAGFNVHVGIVSIKIVILGGGFAGINLAKALAGKTGWWFDWLIRFIAFYFGY